MKPRTRKRRSGPAGGAALGLPAFTHLSHRGARMVQVGGKPRTDRAATAEAYVTVGPQIAASLRSSGGLAKGPVAEAARIAGILAAKKTAELIPMCHPLALDGVEIDVGLEGPRVHIVGRVYCRDRTGVEMEALTAVTVAALTVYDMVKSASKGVEIGPIRLLAKSGGKSGLWKREGGGDG